MSGKTVELLYWDSSVFLDYFEATPGRIDVLETILAEVQRSDGGKKIVTSILSKVEVAFAAHERTQQQLDSVFEDKIDAFWNDTSIITFIEFHEGIVSKARTLMRNSLVYGWSLKAGDAIHLASAQWLGVKEIHAYDDKWPKYAPLLGCTIGQPYTTQPRLAGM